LIQRIKVDYPKEGIFPAWYLWPGGGNK